MNLLERAEDQLDSRVFKQKKVCLRWRLIKKRGADRRRNIHLPGDV